MVKRFLIFAILGVITLNVNIICHSLHLGKHGSKDVSAADVCPIKGPCQHHQHGSNGNHSHSGHGKQETGFIKCDCSQDNSTSSIAYELAIPMNNHTYLAKTILYTIGKENPIFNNHKIIPPEGPPKILLPLESSVLKT